MVGTLSRDLFSERPEACRDFFELLWKQAKKRPDKEALFYEGRRYSYVELLERAAAVALQMQSAGIRAGDKVAILFPNHPDYVLSFFAAAGIGAIIIPINPLLKSDEISHILNDSQASAIILHSCNLSEAMKSQVQNPDLKQVFVGGIEEQSPDSQICMRAVEAGIKIEALSTERANPDKVHWHRSINHKRDLALLVYTSGTTGKPKGAMLTHSSMLSVFPSRLDLFEIDESDVAFAALPMCHIYGIAVLMLSVLSVGGTLAIMPRFDAARALQLIQDEKVTLVPAVPAMYQFMLMELARNYYDLSCVRVCFSGAAPLPADFIKDIETAFGAVLVEGFGMTETSCVSTINPLNGPRKAGSVGKPLPGVQARIVDEEGRDLGPGAANVGELWIKGPNVMLGYYRAEEETAKVLRDGWLATGDLAYRDEDNYFYIAGRKKELIIRGGFNIYPREIEDVLLKMEEIAEAAVVGVPDKLMGERVKAVIVPRSGRRASEESIRQFCAEHLAEYKVPRIFEFRDSLPRNSTGKILKRLLVESDS